MSSSRALRCVFLVLFVFAAGLHAQQADLNNTDQISQDVVSFLRAELAAHVSDIKSLDPPQERVVGALTVGEFSWGAFMRSLASYADLSGDRQLAGRDIPKLIGQVGLIEARDGGKTFAQLYAAIALRHFGNDLERNAVWQSLSNQEQAQWRSLLDPARFYDFKNRKVINLPENYFGVAARVAAIDFQLGIITDRTVVDDILNRAAEQFTRGSLYADDGYPAGRFDRYSNEYARYVYLAAEDAGRKDLMSAMELSLKAQMKLWWDLLSPDGYGYPWGRSLGAISYIDTMEIVGFLAGHPQFRPASLPELGAAYRAAWRWLKHDYQRERHLLNVFAFGRGNYSYINKEREWQQTGAFFGKVAGAQIWFNDGTKRESLSSIPPDWQRPDLARFEYFRKGDRPAGVWIVRQGNLRFVLPIVLGTKPGMSDYLPAPYDLVGFAPPVEQIFPTLTPFLELADGTVIVAADGADGIEPSADGRTLHATWRRWTRMGGKAGNVATEDLRSEVTWKIEGDSLVRTEELTASKPITIRRMWVSLPSTGSSVDTEFKFGRRVDVFHSDEGDLEASITDSDFPFTATLHANGNSKLGMGSRGAVPLYLEWECRSVELTTTSPRHWILKLKASRIPFPFPG